MVGSDDDKIRLGRTLWKSTQMLAEELMAMLKSNVVERLGGTIFKQAGTEGAPVTIRTHGDIVMRIEAGKGTNNPTEGDVKATPEGLKFFPDAPLETKPYNADGSPFPFAEGDIPQEVEDTGGGDSSGGGGIPAKVTASINANSYTVTLYPNGSSGAAGSSVTATVIGSVIATGESLPTDGTFWVMVTQLTDADDNTIYQFAAETWL